MTLWHGLALTLFATFIGATGALYLKKGTNNNLNLFSNWELGLGVICYGFGAVLVMIALKFGDLNIIFPVTAFTYVWSMLLSKYFLKEQITILRIIGILLVVTGIILTILK